MKFKPETTGVGSLPFSDYQDAIDHVFSNYSIPFFPQLPNHRLFNNSPAAQMLQEVIPENILAKLSGNPVPGLAELDSAWDIDLKRFPGIGPFKKRLDSNQSKFFKLQLAGPGTALAALDFYTGRTFETGLTCLFRKKFVAQARHLIDHLRTKDKTCIFLWDELFVNSSSENSLADLFQIEGTGKVISGLHNCAPLNPEVFASHSDNRYLSADFSLLSMEEPSNVQALKRIIGRGGLVAGIVNTQKTTVEKSTVLGLWQRVTSCLGNTVQHSAMPLILSGGCGTGLHTVDFELALAKMLGEIRAIELAD